MAVNRVVSDAAMFACIACLLLSSYFSWRVQKRNADVSYLCLYPALIVYFLLNGSPIIFKILIIPVSTIAFVLNLYRLRKPA